MRIGHWELLLILAVILLLFGPRRLPDIGRAFGKTIREFRHATSEKDEDNEKKNAESRPPKDKS